jgi:hypothetical protein
MANVIDKVVDATQTLTTTRTDRAGYTVERVGKLIDADVSHKTIASQMTDNSSNNHTYTETDVKAYEKLWKDVKTKVVINKVQTATLINDNKENSLSPRSISVGTTIVGKDGRATTTVITN